MTTGMKHIVKVFTLLFLFATVGSTAKADEKVNVVKQGTVRGRIMMPRNKPFRVPPSTSRNCMPE